MPLRPFLALLALLSLAACSREPQPLADFDPHQKFRNTVEKHEAVAVVAPTADGGLGPTDRAVLADLAREHLRRGAGPVRVSVAYGGDAAAAQAFAAQVVAGLDAEGADAIVLALVPTPGAAGPAAEIAVPVWVAQVPECGTWDERINPNYRNQNTSNFGCAMTRNIGLMVANPADLERARDATGRSGVRSQDVLTKYGEGKATASKVEDAKPAATLSVVGTGR
jgi:pilus assembly protein CpaD